MGAFVLGILVGWLAEWLFFTFWIKGRSTGKFADCTALKNELSVKNKEIATLKSDLDKTKKSVTSAKDASKVPEKAEAKKSITSSSTSKKSGASDVAKTATKTTKASVAATTSKTKTIAKATTKSAPTKSASTKKSPVKKATAKAPSAKKPPAKKPPAKSSTAKVKAAPAAKKTVAKKAPTKKKMSGDDLTNLSGIGPSMAATLNELGITSYKKLADMDDDILRDMLEASGARLNNNKEAMDTWNEQANLADKGDLVGLKKLQDSLKK